MGYRIETYSRLTFRGRRHFFRIRHANGQIVAQGDTSGYHNKADMMDTIGNLRNGLHVAPVVQVAK